MLALLGTLAPIAQGIERLPPEQKAVGSNPTGGTVSLLRSPRLESRMDCSYFDAGVCRSCTLMGVPYAEQLEGKERLARDLLAPFGDPVWLPAVASAEAGYRNKAKMVVGGT